LYYFLHPTVGQELNLNILTWADQRAKQLIGSPAGLPAWYISVFPEQLERIRELESAGFS